MNRRKVLLLVTIYSLLVTLVGCDAFVRKFTRKPKKENLPVEEMVLVPQEYNGPQMTKEEQYRQYFLFWKSWHDELYESLLQKKSNKKQIDCTQEALKNLLNLKALLNENTQAKLEVYIASLREIKDLIADDIYGNKIYTYIRDVEKIKRGILKDFSYTKIKNELL